MIRIEVETLGPDRQPIEEGCYTQFDPTGGDNVVKKNTDRYKRILGDGKATVLVPVVEKQGGPGYSSIMVGVEITVHCDQDANIVREVADMLVADCLEIVDNHIHNAYSILLSHRDQLNQQLADKGWVDD